MSNSTIINYENLDKLKVPELKQLCKQNNITGYSKNRDELIKYIIGKKELFTNINEEFKAKMLKEKNKKNNKGERDEILCKKKIFIYNHNKEYNELEKIFGPSASKGIIFIDLKTNKEIHNIEELSKAGPNYKADCKIKFIETGDITCSSIKSKNCGSPSIMNHTPRSAKVFQSGGYLNNILSDIDKMVIKLILLYKDKEYYPEEICFDKLKNFSETDKSILIELIRYFMFVGSGNGNSKQEANSLIIFDKKEIKYIDLKTEESQKEYIKDNFKRFNISLVSRKNYRNLKYKDEIENECYSDIKFKEKYELMKPWVFETTDKGINNPNNKIKCKTALHIRMKCV